MCRLPRSGKIIAVSLFAGALSAFGVSAFRPPAFSHVRQAPARAKTTVIAYVENPNAKEERVSILEEKLKESEAKFMNLQFEMIAGKIDAMAKDVNFKFDATNSRIDDTNGKIDAKASKIDTKIDATNAKIDKIQMGVVAIACLGLTQTLPLILAFLK
jgi:hypothetical protein